MGKLVNNFGETRVNRAEGLGVDSRVWTEADGAK